MRPRKWIDPTTRIFVRFRWLMLSGVLFAQQAAAAQEPMAWKVRDLVQAQQATFELRDRRDRPLRQLDVSQLIYIYSVMSAIEEAAEITAELYIVAGNGPNAFAGSGGQGENIVGIDFGMLDLIGRDVHAAAAILGHELAHLKLNHGEQARKAQSRPSNSLFSASDTKYSRDNEREADYLGMIWTIEAGYDPEGAVRVQEKLYKLSKTGASGFSGSHPSSIERITVLKSMARRLGR
jgi:predicted Zn-dependent protease